MELSMRDIVKSINILSVFLFYIKPLADIFYSLMIRGYLIVRGLEILV